MFPDKRAAGQIPGGEQGESEMKDQPEQEKKQKKEWRDPSFLLEGGSRVL